MLSGKQQNIWFGKNTHIYINEKDVVVDGDGDGGEKLSN